MPKSIHILLGTLLLVASLILPPRAGAQDCRLRVDPSISLEDQAALRSLNYHLLGDSRLDFSYYRLPFSLNLSSAFALEIRPQEFRIYFALESDKEVLPYIYTAAPTSRQLPTCQRVHELAESLSQNRQLVREALPSLKEGAPLGPAFLKAEAAYQNLRHAGESKLDAAQSYQQLLSLIREKVKLSGKAEDFFRQHDQIRQIVFAYGLSNYCPGQASLSQFLATRCANCSAQTKLFLSLYHDLGIKPAPGWVFGAEVFADHVRPVIVNFKDQVILDLVYNTKSIGLVNPIMTPAGLLRQTLKGVQNVAPLIFLESDGFSATPLKSYNHIPRSTLSKIEAMPLPKMDKIETSGKAMPIDPTVFDVPSTHFFSTTEAPTRADISFALKRSSEEGLNHPDPPQEDAYTGLNKSPDSKILLGRMSRKVDDHHYNKVTNLALDNLLMNEAFFWRRIWHDQRYQPPDLAVLGFGLIKGYQPPRDLVEERLMQPLKIELAILSPGESRTFQAYTEANVKTLRVYEPTVFVRLSKGSLAEKYGWLYQQLQIQENDFFALHEGTLNDFLAAENPLAYWRSNQVDATRALESLDELIRGYHLLGDQKEGINFLVNRNPRLDRLWSVIQELRQKNVGSFTTRTREILSTLNALGDDSLLDFFAWYNDFDRLVDTYGPVLNLDTKSDQFERSKTPLAALLERVLFDEDFLYTTRLNLKEKELYRNFFKEAGPKAKPDPFNIHLPKMTFNQPCAPNQYGWDLGNIIIECPAPKLKVGRLRVPVELNPLILVGLAKSSGSHILRPPWAAAIFEAWREAHFVAVKRFLPPRHWTPPGSILPTLEVYWGLLDGLLANNLPAFVRSSIDQKDLQHSSLEFRQRYQNYIRTFPGGLRPEWAQDSPVFGEAYDFYVNFRPEYLKKTIRVAEYLGSEVEPSAYLVPPVQSAVPWKVEFSNPDSSVPTQPWGWAEFFTEDDDLMGVSLRALEKRRAYIIEMRRYGGQFYFAPPNFN